MNPPNTVAPTPTAFYSQHGGSIHQSSLGSVKNSPSTGRDGKKGVEGTTSCRNKTSPPTSENNEAQYNDIAARALNPSHAATAHVGQSSVIVHTTIPSCSNTAPSPAGESNNVHYNQHASQMPIQRSIKETEIEGTGVTSSSWKASAPTTSDSNAARPGIHARFSNYLIESQYSYFMLASRKVVQTNAGVVIFLVWPFIEIFTHIFDGHTSKAYKTISPRRAIPDAQSRILQKLILLMIRDI